MRKFVTLCCALLLSINAFAEQALSKVLIEQYVQLTNKITPLMNANPELDREFDELKTIDKAKIIDKLKSTAIYPEFKAAVIASGFDNVEHYLDISFRIMGAIFNAQMQQLPEGMKLDGYLEQMKEQVEMMKKQGMPQEMISEMESSMTEQLKDMAFMQEAAASASAADIKFVSENLDWIMQILPAEQESNDEFDSN